MDDAEIHYCTKNISFNLEANPYIDKIHLLEDNLQDLIIRLKKEKFDVIIDLHNNLRTQIIKRLLRTRSYSFNKINFEKWLLVNLKINRLPNVHIVDRYMETVKSLGVKPDNLGLDYFIPENQEIEDSWLPELSRKDFVVFAIGGESYHQKITIRKND